MDTHTFAGLDGRNRQEKPRTTGRTMVIDWGMGPHAQEDLLVTAAPFFDFAKVAVGISRLLDNELLTTKIDTYREHGIEAFPGGQFLEYAEMQGRTDMYLPAVAEAGYRWMEVSDNLAPVELAWKTKLIKQAVDEYAMQVFGEVGKKEGLGKGVPMLDDAKACLDAGASIILLEAAELIQPETATEVEHIVQAIGVDQVMFELPGPWIEGVNLFDIHRMRRELIDRYGPDVNLGNVDAGEIVAVEAYRRALGVNAGHSPE
ncbi:MAG: phosphosulfolactate synthase [Candidatus Pacebacteria bacterium]|nr:phosphosulfolactate synthase [Candidatus Paceibacterota bacterium]